MPLEYPFALLLTSTMIGNQEKSPLPSLIRALLLKGQGTTRTALRGEGLHGGVGRHDVLLVDAPVGDRTLTIPACIAGATDTLHSNACNLTQDVQLRIASCLRLTCTSNQELCVLTSLCTPVGDR